MAVNWYIKHFNELSPEELHDLVALRIEVFVMEQNCTYQDLDGKDKYAHQIFAVDENKKVLATARILPQGISYAEVSIGRVASSDSVRGTGIGQQMMERAMAFIQQHYGEVDVRISAQEYLLNFYGKFGFQSTGKHYLEDDLPHVEMLYKSN
ncbi:MAG: GNAT family N-acetyltransferase [Bacteroidota bacterium]